MTLKTDLSPSPETNGDERPQKLSAKLKPQERSWPQKSASTTLSEDITASGETRAASSQEPTSSSGAMNSEQEEPKKRRNTLDQHEKEIRQPQHLLGLGLHVPHNAPVTGNVGVTRPTPQRQIAAVRTSVMTSDETPQTLVGQMVRDDATASLKIQNDLSATPTFMEPATTGNTLPAKRLHDHDENPIPPATEVETKTSSPAPDNLHKRRAFVSPEKFNNGRFEPLTIRTDLNETLPTVSPTKRLKLGEKVEVYYDANGTPRLRVSPGSALFSSCQEALTPALTAPAHARSASGSPTSPTSTASQALTVALPDAHLQRQARSVDYMRGLLLLPPVSQAPTPSPTSPHSRAMTKAMRGIPASSPAPPELKRLIAESLHGPRPKPWTNHENATVKKPFRLLERFTKDSALCMVLVSYLDIPSLIAWYAIDKFFHWTFNREATAFILSSMRTWAPDADKISPWRCYTSLCIKDPCMRQKASALHADRGRQADIDQLHAGLRDVPSMRWLQMVAWREAIAEDIVLVLRTRGLLLPNLCIDTLKRMWFVLDLPKTAHRVALMRDPRYFTNRTLYSLLHFFLRVDMAFTNPRKHLFIRAHNAQLQIHATHNGCVLREFLLAERHITSLWRVLRGWSWDPTEGAVEMTELDMVRLWLRNEHRSAGFTTIALESLKFEAILAFEDEVNTVGSERQWALDADTNTKEHFTSDTRLRRPDELLVAECVRRRLNIHQHLTTMMLLGFGDHQGRRAQVPTEEVLMRMRARPWEFPTSVVQAKSNNDGGKKQASEEKQSQASEQAGVGGSTVHEDHDGHDTQGGNNETKAQEGLDGDDAQAEQNEEAGGDHTGGAEAANTNSGEDMDVDAQE